MNYPSRLLVCAVAAVVGHLPLIRGVVHLPQRAEAARPVVVQVLLKAPPPVPEPPPEPEATPEPKTQPEHQAPARRRSRLERTERCRSRRRSSRARAAATALSGAPTVGSQRPS